MRSSRLTSSVLPTRLAGSRLDRIQRRIVSGSRLAVTAASLTVSSKAPTLMAGRILHNVVCGYASCGTGESEKSDIVGGVRIKATEASRGFSSLLTRVAAGETVEVDRHGEVVAVVSPPGRRMISGAALRELMEHLPRPGEGFREDVRGLRNVTARPSDPWPS